MINKELKPGLVAATISIVFLVTFLVVGGSIAGSYALTLHAIHDAQVQQAALAEHAKVLAMQLQLKQAVATCKSLVVLDHAGHGIKFPAVNKSHPSETALTRLFKGIHDVVVTSHCYALLNGTYHPKG